MSFLERWSVEAGKLKRRFESVGRRALLEENAELRKNPDALLDLSFMGLSLQIPEPDLYALWRKYPDLNAQDRMTKRNAWLLFIGSAEADPYRVRQRRSRRAGVPTTARASTANSGN